MVDFGSLVSTNAECPSTTTTEKCNNMRIQRRQDSAWITNICIISICLLSNLAIFYFDRAGGALTLLFSMMYVSVQAFCKDK